MASRFATVSKDEIVAVKEAAAPANTKKETKFDLSVEKIFILNMQQNDKNDSETLSIANVVAGRGTRSYPPKEGAMSKLFNGKSDISTF